MNEFDIPKNSFTAFRLTYLQIHEIAESSKTILLGKSPFVYGNDSGKGIISSAIHKAKTKARSTFDSTLKAHVLKDDRDAISSWFKLNNDKSIDMILEELNESDEDSGEGEETELNGMESGELNSMAESREPHDKQGENHNLQELEGQGSHDLDPLKGQGSHDLEPLEGQGSHDLSSTLYSQETKESRETQPILKFPVAAPSKASARKIHFKNTIKKTRITIAKPEPISEINGLTETLIDKREHHQFRKRLKNFAKLSGDRAWDKTHNISTRILKSIIGNFKIGEIVLKERVLVLTKETYNTSKFSKFDENEPCDTRVYERWKEYKVALKKTDQSVITIQFIHLDHDDEKPEYEYELSSDLIVNLYNYIDKSLCLLVPKDHWSIVHIIKFHDQMKSMRWLFFMKQVLGHTSDNGFNIVIPDIDIQLTVRVPEHLLLKMFTKSSVLKVKQTPQEYHVQHSIMIQYVLDTIKAQILESGNPKLIEWLEQTIRPWFCFRFYDRLEWIIDDSELFYVQNQVFKNIYVLEIRDMINYKRILKIDNKILAPIPIEGFLSRLSDINGVEKSLNTYYKVSYFHTCDNLLYFTKYYRALPPIGLSSVYSEEEDVFSHCSYNLDENDHVEWLNSKEFRSHDRLAFKEFERKSQLILKADSVIDLNHIVDIKVVPPESLKAGHKILFGLMWYGSRIEDETLFDSVFELTIMNQGTIKLQAPNPRIRDEWVKRLNDMRKYWKTRKQLEIEKINEVRLINMKRLQIDESTDSNINHMSTHLEINNSVANTYLNTVDYISLGNSLMINGYLYQKYKKHANFNQYFVALSSGCLVLYSLYQRSKLTGEWKRSSYYQHHLTIPVDECYVYSGDQSALDLVEHQKEYINSNPIDRSLPRIYSDGWKSSEEESVRCFTLWFGKKRYISKNTKDEPDNPGLLRLIKRLGITGKSMVFMTRSRQERDLWVSRIYAEIDRYTRLYSNSSEAKSNPSGVKVKG